MTTYDELLQERLEAAQAAVLVKMYVEDTGKKKLEQYEADLADGKVPEITDEELHKAFNRFLEISDIKEEHRAYQPFLRAALKTVAVAIASIIIFVLSMVTVQAAGVDVFGAVARWTDNVLVIKSEDVEAGSVIVPHLTPSEEIRLALIDQGIPEDYAPSRMPNTYEIIDLQRIQNKKEKQVIVTVSDAEKNIITFQFKKSDYSENKNIIYYEKDKPDIKYYLVGDKKWAIYYNNGFLSAIWQAQQYEIDIIGCKNMEQLYKILESIGGT